jgi:NAD(P)H-dependent flavin oxidoreductase YrpB (nitropropane dioxygenase family)
VTHPTLTTRLCELVGIDYPIVQTGMGWVAGPRLAAATSNAGGLGILAASTMDFDQLRAAIAETKQRTSKPFGVNIRSDAPDAVARIDVLIEQNVRVASFALAPKQELIARLKDAGVVVMPSIGAKRHAEKVAQWGVDAVIVQGGEGGGHTGPVPTSLLLPQVVDALDIPVVAAGGFFDGRGLVAALAYGAAGVAMGTRFLLTRDSTVTTQVDGVPHRVLRSELVEQLERTGRVTGLPRALRNALAFKRLSGTPWRSIVEEGFAMRRNQDLTWSQVVMAANTPMLLKAAMVDGQPDLGVMSSGQVVGVIEDLPTVAQLVSRIVDEAESTLKRLGA